MKFNLILLLTSLPLLALGNPIPDPEAVAIADPQFDSVTPGNLFTKRADKWCHVVGQDGPVNCRKTPGGSFVRKIQSTEQFGVRCKKSGPAVFGVTTWDWIPGWGCWVTAYYTRPSDGSRTCETNVPWC